MLPIAFRQDVPPEFRRRANFLMTIAAIVFLLLLGRLFVLQVLQGERFTYLSENNRIRLKKIPGTRGMVFDRNGQLVVDSRPSFDLLFVPEDTDDPALTLRRLARFLARDEGDFLGLLEQNKGRPPFEEIVLGRDVDWRALVAVETHQLDLPGVSLRVRPRRSYLLNSMAAHVLGYMGEIGPKQLKVQKE